MWPVRTGVAALHSNRASGIRYLMTEPWQCETPRADLKSNANECVAQINARAKAAFEQANLEAERTNRFFSGQPAEYLDAYANVAWLSQFVGSACTGDTWGGNLGVDDPGVQGNWMAHEATHCLGLPNRESPHYDGGGQTHSKNELIDLGGQTHVNLLDRRDYSRAHSLMFRFVGQNDHNAMLEGWEWNELRKRLVALGPQRPPSRHSARAVSAIHAFGTIAPDGDVNLLGTSRATTARFSRGDAVPGAQLIFRAGDGQILARTSLTRAAPPGGGYEAFTVIARLPPRTVAAEIAGADGTRQRVGPQRGDEAG
jgi:hypothetical protein